MDIKIKKIFIGTQLILYTIFMYLDIFQQSLYITSSYLKFISIIICVLYVIISFPYRHADIDRWLLLLAIIFTLFSDWFILIRDKYTYGVITFIIVQYLYLIRIHRHNENITIVFFLKKLFINIGIASGIILILLFLPMEVDILIVLSLFYFVTFVMNVIHGIYLLQKEKSTLMDKSKGESKNKSKDLSFRLFIMGIILFLLCDINVGIFNLTSYLSMNSNWFAIVENFSSVAMWMFYLPSQVMISISNLSKEHWGK